jgi:hypothetical protein
MIYNYLCIVKYESPLVSIDGFHKLCPCQQLLCTMHKRNSNTFWTLAKTLHGYCNSLKNVNLQIGRSFIHLSTSNLTFLPKCKLPELLYSNLGKQETIALMQGITSLRLSTKEQKLLHCCKTSTHIS